MCVCVYLSPFVVSSAWISLHDADYGMGWMESSYKYGDAAAAAANIVSHQSQSAA